MAELKIAADVTHLQEVLDFVDSELRKAKCFSKTRMRISVVVEEAFVNIANYAYAPGSGSAIIQCEIKEDPRVLELVFIDQGKPFDPIKKEDPDITLPPEQRQIGGLGVLMIKRFMDKASYRYENGSNILTLIKYL